MAQKTLIGGTAYEIEAGRTLVNGTGYDIIQGRTLVDGTGYDIFFDIPLEDLQEGEIVLIRENGLLTEFLIAKHNYESGLNGSGRTLLVRKEPYEERPWHSDSTAQSIYYGNCELDTWFNTEYKAVFDAATKDAIATTKILCYPIGSVTEVISIDRSVFALSNTEFTGSRGANTSLAAYEGSLLPTADKLMLPQYYWTSDSLEGQHRYEQHTRTRYNNGNESVLMFGTTAEGHIFSRLVWARPAFTMPGKTRVDRKTYEVKA